jgi:protein SCO1/2
VATPDGHLARYLYGVDFAPRDLKFSLLEASNGKIGSPLDKALLVCFRYDAALGKYTAATMLILRVGATLTIAALGAFLYFALRRERRSRQLAAGGLA